MKNQISDDEINRMLKEYPGIVQEAVYEMWVNNKLKELPKYIKLIYDRKKMRDVLGPLIREALEKERRNENT